MAITLETSGGAQRYPIVGAQWDFGADAPTGGADGDCYFRSTGQIYKRENGVWNLKDAVLNVAEPALGNPGTSGYVLSSTDAGVRSWIAPGSGEAMQQRNPDMTNYTSPLGTAFASSWSNVDALWGGEAWKAMDGNAGTGWVADMANIPLSLGYLFASATAITHYAIIGHRGEPANAPKSWTLQGSLDTTTGSDGTWVDLDVRATETGWTTAARLYQIPTFPAVAYVGYRLVITDNNTNQYVGVCALMLIR